MVSPLLTILLEVWCEARKVGGSAAVLPLGPTGVPRVGSFLELTTTY